MLRIAAGFALASALLTAAPAISAPAAPAIANTDIGLALHRAEYAMTLNSSRLSGGVTAASGKMSYRFGDSCDGWTVENKTAVNFAYADGGPVTTTWDYVTWESKDGLKFRFRVRSTRDGAVNQEIAGSAALDGKGKGGTVRFTQPETKTMSLPPGTLFPTEHTVRMLEAAQKGGRSLSKTVFDGTDDAGPFSVSGVVGRVFPANSNTAPGLNKPAVDATLLSAPSWVIELAFYPVGSNDAEPDYEVGLRYYLNGVADEMIQSYGDFTLKATLEKLEALPRPDC